MALLEAKTRIAEALEESIFWRARCGIHPSSAEPPPLRVGRDHGFPDILLGLGANGRAWRESLVELKYRPSIEQFVAVENQRGERSVFELARRQWPVLSLVLVSERPEPGRSCFQALPIHDLAPGGPFRTV